MFNIVQRWVVLGAGVGLGAPMKVNIYIKLFLFTFTIIFISITCMQTNKLRQTTENNGGPFTSKSDAKGVS